MSGQQNRGIGWMRAYAVRENDSAHTGSSYIGMALGQGSWGEGGRN